jgi:intein-encoded DNA endonuclease-like protein
VGKYDQYHSEWIELYRSGVSTTEIGKNYNCDASTVGKVMKMLGLIRTPGEANAFTNAKYHNEWVEYYNNGKSTCDIASIYGCSDTTVGVVIKKVGLIRSNTETQLLKYHDYDSYFDTVDTEEKSYYLGLILADGCITSYINHRSWQRRLSITLHYRDAYIIDRLANCLGRTAGDATKKKGSKQRCVNITSDHICNTLTTYGITEHKSTDNHEATIFNYIPPELMRHFIRGFIDGDGCIAIYRNNGRKIGAVNVCGNYNDMVAVSNIFSTMGCKIKMPDKLRSIYRVQWASRDDVTNIIHYLYDDATIYLERKKGKAAEILLLYSDGARPMSNDVKDNEQLIM